MVFYIPSRRDETGQGRRCLDTNVSSSTPKDAANSPSGTEGLSDGDWYGYGDVGIEYNSSLLLRLLPLPPLQLLRLLPRPQPLFLIGLPLFLLLFLLLLPRPMLILLLPLMLL